MLQHVPPDQRLNTLLGQKNGVDDEDTRKVQSGYFLG